MFGALIYRVFDLQIINEEYYLNNYIQTGKKEISVPGTRGIIYDRNGEVLAYNKLAYAITIEDVLSSGIDKSDKLNEIIYNTIKIIEENGDTINNDFSIIIGSNGKCEYSVTSDMAKLRFLRDIYGKSKIEELDTEKEQLSDNTAEEVFEYLVGKKRYDISEEYSKEDRLKIAIIRY
ncbi:MAG: penicillin-binding protein, partial [Lachnospiraceae bacterium]|nr:penicillin-binding protein [Lachnospiraceae bacterium]